MKTWVVKNTIILNELSNTLMFVWFLFIFSDIMFSFYFTVFQVSKLVKLVFLSCSVLFIVEHKFLVDFVNWPSLLCQSYMIFEIFCHRLVAFGKEMFFFLFVHGATNIWYVWLGLRKHAPGYIHMTTWCGCVQSTCRPTSKILVSNTSRTSANILKYWFIAGMGCFYG